MATIVKRQGKKGVSWKVMIRRKGFETITKTFRLKTDAESWARKTENAIEDGEYHESRESRKRTIGEMIDRYCEDFLDGKSAGDTRRQLEWWKKEIGHMPIAAVQASTIIMCRKKLRDDPIVTTRKEKGEIIRTERPRNNATCNRYMAALSTVYTTAVREMQWAKKNPFTEIAPLREAKGRVRYLDDEERERLLAACKASENPYLYPLVVLALSTGMRLGEMLKLSWKDVNLAARRIILQDSKNGSRRGVGIPLRTVEVLETMRRAKVRRIDTDLVFPGQRALNHGPASIRTAWLFALERADIKDFHFHDLRHTFASYLAMRGRSLLEIADALGHKTLAMVQRYAHLSEQHTHGLLDNLSEEIFG